MSKKSIIVIISVIVGIIITATIAITLQKIEPQILKWPFTFDENITELEIPITESCQESYTQDNINFNYPCNWEVKPPEGEKDPILVIHYDKTPPGRIVRVKLPAESFADYETRFQELIQENQMSIRENLLTVNNESHEIKEYGMHGGITYIIEIDNNYIDFGSEFVLNQKELADIYIILSSVKF